MTASKAVDDLMQAFQKLPGVGAKTAQRMVFQLLSRNRENALRIANTLQYAAENVQHCEMCNDFSESTICSICKSSNRNRELLCVVETPADLVSFENSGCYNGLYYVLMGRISPFDGVGPKELPIEGLLKRLSEGEVQEIILATNSTAEGDATADYLAELLEKNDFKTTRLARGLPVGGELEYLDRGTLTEAFQRRIAT